MIKENKIIIYVAAAFIALFLLIHFLIYYVIDFS